VRCDSKDVEEIAATAPVKEGPERDDGKDRAIEGAQKTLIRLLEDAQKSGTKTLSWPLGS